MLDLGPCFHRFRPGNVVHDVYCTCIQYQIMFILYKQNHLDNCQKPRSSVKHRTRWGSLYFVYARKEGMKEGLTNYLHKLLLRLLLLLLVRLLGLLCYSYCCCCHDYYYYYYYHHDHHHHHYYFQYYDDFTLYYYILGPATASIVFTAAAAAACSNWSIVHYYTIYKHII